MEKNEILALFKQEEKKNNSPCNLNRTTSFYSGLENKSLVALAKAVNYCLSNNKLASFKDPNKIIALVKREPNNNILSTYNNTVIYKFSDNLVIQYSKNMEEDKTKINTTKILIGKNGKIEGESKTYTMIKNPDYNEKFTEKELNRCEIPDINNVSIDHMTHEEITLYQQMIICQKLLSQVVDSLTGKRNSKEIDTMFKEQKNAVNNNPDRRKK